MSSEGSRRRCITRCNTQWSPLPSTTDDDVAAVRRFGLLRAAPSRRRHTGGGVAAAAAFCLLLLLFATWPAPSVAHSWGKLAGLSGSRSVAFFGRPGSIHGVEEVAVDMSINNNNNNNNEDEDEKCDAVAARDAVLRRPDDVAAYEVRHAHRKHVASWDGGIAEEEAGALQRRLGTVIPCTIHSTARADDDARRGVQRRPRQFLDSLVVT